MTATPDLGPPKVGPPKVGLPPDGLPQEGLPQDGLPQDGLPNPRRIWALISISLGTILVVLDNGMLNVALPAIARDLAIPPAQAIWLVSAYQLGLIAALLTAASLGEILGYKRIFLTGATIFGIGAAASTFQTEIIPLALCRVVQGIGASGTLGVTNALLRFTYPRAKLGVAVGLNSMLGTCAMIAGPSLSAVVLEIAPWPAIFAINVPMAAITITMGIFALPNPPRTARSFDTLSALLNAATCALGLLALDSIAHKSPIPTIALQAAAAIGLGYFLVRRQRGRTAPLLPVDLLRIPVLSLSVGTSLCYFIAAMSLLVGTPFLLVQGLHLSQMDTGIAMTPAAIAIAILGPIAGRLADRYSAAILCSVGMAITALGLATLILIPDAPSLPNILWRIGICGIGFGITIVPNHRTMVASAPPDRSGGASGLLAMSRVTGQSIGTVLVAICFGLFSATNAPTASLLIGIAASCLGIFLSLGRTSFMPTRATKPR